ncbi:MAG: triose-phosphate isomerase [Bacteroidetes bacterium]|nr:triose-phosphate isomerase [Bacteroidota bacterium]
MRTQIIAGNWKMNNDLENGIQLATAIIEHVKANPTEVEVVLIPPFIHLHSISAELKEITPDLPLRLGAQNCHQEESGPFTGEVSAAMLKSVGVEYVVLGHSERRQYFDEYDKEIYKKMVKVLEAEMTPIFCCGESLVEREQDKQLYRVEQQVKEALFHLDESDIEKIVIAYEPVWAIGTGKTASPEQAQEMHAFIRNLIRERYTDEVALKIPILYGGSVNQENASELFAQEDLDGGLVGGASLKAEEFGMIINSLEQSLTV